MIESAIIVNYDPFAMESKVGIMQDGKKEYVKIASSLSSLANDLIVLSYKYDIYKVKIAAPFTIMSEISRQISELEKTNYSINKIVVEGI